ncbi:probable cytochrome P450 6a13 [Aethina tumida]|uniref:probable cytochrome P450 6a13 n=1 Tax=Aethina tumida TaxID=116153 RepID=UPI00214973B6|nr:probable cytochrome P450 6a13 [Aethina tumida]
MLFTSSLKVDLIGFIVVLVSLFVAFVKWKFTYWQRRGLLNPEPTFFIGNMWRLVLQKITFGDHIQETYNFLKAKNQRHGGEYFFMKPMYVPIDPEIVKNIMQNDFLSFMDRGIYFNETDPLSLNLFFISGMKWKNLRSKLTPTFTSGKMKMMFETLVKCGNELQKLMDENVGKPVELKDVLGRFTTDVIGSVAFGIECNSLKDPSSEFRHYSAEFFKSDLMHNLKSIISFIWPEPLKFFNVKTIKPEINDFFMNITRETVEYREKHNVKRKDFLDLLIQLKNTGKLEEEHMLTEEKLSFEELAAQSFVFFIAGYETSSTTMTFALYELAEHPELQDKLREEVDRVLNKYNGQLTYDAMMEMTYMDKVINETLRLYPPLPSLNRLCTKEYHVPGTDVILEKGTKIHIPVIALHLDEDYFPNPKQFDPERFTESRVGSVVPYTFLPFGDGPRNCIGERFGKMQTKVGLTVMIKNYKFTLNPKTKVPLVMDTRSFIPTTLGGMWMDYEKV